MEEKTCWEEELQQYESEFQDFKIFAAMGESVPQFILASTILVKQGSLNNWYYQLNPLTNPLAFFQLLSSIMSVILTVTSLFTDMVVNDKIPLRNASYKYGKVAPVMLLCALPRLFSLSVLFSCLTLSNWQFHILITFGLLLYGLFYSILTFSMKRIDKNMHGLTVLGYFTSIISPCIFGSFQVPFFMLSSIFSSVFHSLMLWLLWYI